MDIKHYLRDRTVPFETILHHDTYGAQRLAHALHVPGRDVAKSILLRAGHGYVLAVLPATKVLDARQISEFLGGVKVELATEIEIGERFQGCEIGVLSPFGSQYGLTTIVEESLAAEENIVFDCGTHHEAIRMKFADYRSICLNFWALLRWSSQSNNQCRGYQRNPRVCSATLSVVSMRRLLS
jgi:Ala-tRNA(Pro) deacylase